MGTTIRGRHARFASRSKRAATAITNHPPPAVFRGAADFALHAMAGGRRRV